MTNTTPAPAGPGGDYFLTTQWTRVLASRGDSPEARQALADLCEAYYKPVFGFIRRSAPNEDAARELTQEFFARLLAGHGFQTVNPERGRFRYFLLGAVKHFLANVWDHESRLKRGGGQAVLSLDAGTDSSPAIQVPDPNLPSPDLEFDRKWTLTLLERALNRLGSEQKEAGKGEEFEVLKPWLTGDSQETSQADAAARLRVNEGALRVAIHRLRKRFRDFVKEEIAGTVNDPAHVKEELSYLFEVLGGG